MPQNVAGSRALTPLLDRSGSYVVLGGMNPDLILVSHSLSFLLSPMIFLITFWDEAFSAQDFLPSTIREELLRKPVLFTLIARP